MPTSSPGDQSDSSGSSKFRLAAGLPDHLRFIVIAWMVLETGLVTLAARGQVSFTTFGLLTVLLAALALWVHLAVLRQSAGKDLRPRPGEPVAVGVLSFAEKGASRVDESQGDGFAEEVIKKLRDVPGLAVKPQHAMLRYKGTRTPAERIALELGTNCLVRGTLGEEAGAYALEVELLQMWDGGRRSESFSRPESQWFELQADVAEWLAERLVAIQRPGETDALSSAERSRLRAHPPHSREAEHSYHDARAEMRSFNRRRDPETFQAAESAFLEAVENEESYIEARSMLGFLYLLNWETAGGRRWVEKSRQEFTRVVEREPNHPVATAELGYLDFVSGRMEEGFEQVEAAARRHPEETIPQNVRALIHLYLGFYESAIEITEKVVELDPHYIYPPTNASTCCYLSGDCDDALWWAEKPEGTAPRAFIAPLVEGAAWFCKNELRAADRAWRRGLKVAPPALQSLFRVTRAWIHAARGDSSAPRATIREFRDEPWIDGAYGPYFISLCALAGEDDLAVDLIRRQTTWASSYRYLLGDPTLEPLADHSGFQDLLHERYEDWTSRAARMNVTPAPPSLPAPRERQPA